MNFLLAGGAGYLGGRIARHLQSKGHNIHVLTRRDPSQAPKWLQADRISQCHWASAAEVLPFIQDAQMVVQLAGADQQTAARDPAAALHASAAVNWALMEAVVASRSRPVVLYVSTFHVYGRATGEITESRPPAPVHPYALAKRFGEEVIDLFRRERGARTLSIRLANAFGAPEGAEISQWSLAFNDFCRQAVEQRRIILRSSGGQSRNFITLEDTARAIEFLAHVEDRWPEDGILHVGSMISLTVKEAAEMVAARAVEVLGYLPEIVAPQESVPPSEPFSFKSERLERLGFTWQNDWRAEIDATLRLCSREFGPAADPTVSRRTRALSS